VYKKDDTLYFTPIRNQVHQIKNKIDFTAVTLQAYLRDDDPTHYQESFDYIDNGNIRRFIP
jgi:hypothetical protein